MGTVVALFDTYPDAEQGVNTLVARGFDRNSVSLAVQESAVMARNGAGGTYDAVGVQASPDVAEGASTGTLVGGGAGLLAGIAALMIPGVGPLFVTGALASIITSAVAGATAGAVTGGLASALADHGLPDDTADLYVEGVKNGGVLLSVNTDRVDQARAALEGANATNIHDMMD